MVVSYCCVVDRAYKRYSIPENPSLSYLHHPSGVTVLALNEDHEPLASEVTQVDFNVGKKNSMERGEQQVSGKGKKGALLVQKDTRLCIIRCADGTERVIRAGIKGTMVEVNDRLKTHPDLIRTAPENQGYICILTYGAGKRKLDEFVHEMPVKRVMLREEEEGSKEPTTNSEEKTPVKEEKEITTVPSEVTVVENSNTVSDTVEQQTNVDEKTSQ